MLSPDQLGEVRRRLEAGQLPERLDGVRLEAVEVAGGSPAATVHAEAEWWGPFTPPERIFGEPADASCLDGIPLPGLPAPGQPVPEKLLRRAEGARIVGSTAVLDGQACLYLPDPVVGVMAEPLLAANRAGHHGCILEPHDNGLRCRFAQREVPEFWEHDAAFLHNLEPTNYGSFLFRQLPQLILLRSWLADAGADAISCYVTPRRTPFLLEGLRLLGLPELPVFTVAEICGDFFRSVTFCNEFDAEGLLSPTTRAGLAELAAPARGTTRLYVSRDLGRVFSGGYRALRNAPAVEAMMQHAGFTIVHPETLSLHRQAALFAGARCIAGPSGSGMLNAMFAPEGARVLDLESHHETVRQHAKIYASAGKRYGFLFGAIEPGEGRLLSRPWRVAPRLLEAGLAWLAG